MSWVRAAYDGHCYIYRISLIRRKVITNYCYAVLTLDGAAGAQMSDVYVGYRAVN